MGGARGQSGWYQCRLSWPSTLTSAAQDSGGDVFSPIRGCWGAHPALGAGGGWRELAQANSYQTLFPTSILLPFTFLFVAVLKSGPSQHLWLHHIASTSTVTVLVQALVIETRAHARRTEDTNRSLLPTSSDPWDYSAPRILCLRPKFKSPAPASQHETFLKPGSGSSLPASPNTTTLGIFCCLLFLKHAKFFSAILLCFSFQPPFLTL